MGVTLIMPQDKFFEKVLADSSMLSVAESLVDSGVVFDISVFSVTATYGGNKWNLNLPVGISALMKDVKAADPSGVSVKMVEQFVSKLSVAIAGMPKSSVPPSTSLGELLKQKLKEPYALTPASVKAPMFPPKNEPKAKPGVIPLIEAEVVGQQVKGTSGGSVYRAIAISDRIKVAAKVNGSQISIRVEGNPNPTDLVNIGSAGVVWHGKYGSCHLDASGVPVKRVIGAVLYSMGTKFDRVLAAGEDVPQ